MDDQGQQPTQPQVDIPGEPTNPAVPTDPQVPQETPAEPTSEPVAETPMPDAGVPAEPPVVNPTESGTIPAPEELPKPEDPTGGETPPAPAV